MNDSLGSDIGDKTFRITGIRDDLEMENYRQRKLKSEKFDFLRN
jgi:hypothetical protein